MNGQTTTSNIFYDVSFFAEYYVGLIGRIARAYTTRRTA